MDFTIKHNHPSRSFVRTARTPSGVRKQYTFKANLPTEVPDTMVPSLARDLKDGNLFVAQVNSDKIHAKPDYEKTAKLVSDITSGAFVRSKAAKENSPKPARKKRTTRTAKPSAEGKE